jgi:neutral ceramidase
MMTSRVLLSLLLVTLSAGRAGAEFRAGAAKQSIVPPFPTRMGGYFDRMDTFTGVESPVYARALVCTDGETTLAVVSTDLIGVSSHLVESSRERIEAETGIPVGNVLLSASHTHSGPSGYAGSSMFGQPVDTRLSDFLIGKFAEVVAEAHQAMEPAEWGHASGHLATLTRNRQQNNELVIDPEVGVLKVVRNGTNEALAVLFNFTGHPVIMGSTNLLLSSEYPGKAAEAVEAVLGGVALFTQGACGDVTVHRRGSTFSEVARVGRIVGGEVLKTAEQIAPVEDYTLWSEFMPLEVEPRAIPSVAEAETAVEAAEQALAQAKAGGERERRVKELERAVGSEQTTLRVARWVAEEPRLLATAKASSVHVMRLGPVILVGIPGELFVEYGLEMKQRIHQDAGLPTMVVGYANGNTGYIVTPRAVATGGYEQSIARVAPSAGRTMVEAALDTVNAHAE